MELTPSCCRFIKENSDKNPADMRLAYAGKKNDEFDYGFAITQIECRRKFGKKLAQTLGICPDFVFPSVLAGEQATSDALAHWHAGLVKEGSIVVDMTAGLGIDCLHVAERASRITAVERNALTADALAYNAGRMEYTNITVVEGDSVRMLKDGCLCGDVVFIDPARRSQTGGRVYTVSDCEPDVTSLIAYMRQYFSTLIVKLSPMLDVTETIRLLPGVKDIYAVGTPAECKEITAVVALKENPVSDPCIHALTINQDGSVWDMAFTAIAERSAVMPEACVPQAADFVYEPFPAVMKAGGYKLFASRSGLRRLHPNTHVYIGKEIILQVQASVSRIIRVVPWQSKNIKRFRNEFPSGEVAVRNFGMSAEALRARLGVKDGGDVRILGVTDSDNRRLLLVLAKGIGAE
ncbi:MAG: hypothetical protein Q4F07_05005 [Bacteroidales bacterium]|nr:hypothetical protein [Bacteroidales bacterium]